MHYLGYNITTSLEKIEFNKKVVISTLNPHSFVIAREDELFNLALKSSDYLIPDGIGIVLAIRYKYGNKINRITGADLHKYLLDYSNCNCLRVFYLGSTDDTLNKISARLKVEYQNITVKTYSPPYKDMFNEQENIQIINEINTFKPDVLFVGMTAPKQEKWVVSNIDKINSKVVCSIGAVFDFFAGTVKRPQIIWQRLGLEWLIRFINEPKRLAKRTLISMPKYIYYVLYHK
jgi:N-acetylglucosaminyldiphosphoundecaprenol N-acetyl-beta-D-mannosaminyltransferase